MQALREERGLVYSAQTGIELYQQGVFCFGFAGTKTGKEHEVVEQIKQIWQTLKTEEISAADLAHAKNYLTGSLANKLTRNRDIAALIYPIARQQAPLEFLNIRNQMISKVDKISLRNYIKSLPNLEDLPIVIVGSKTIDFRPSQTMK
jgi:zinc protease